MKKLFFLLLGLPLFVKAQTINTVFGPNSSLYCGGWESSIAIDASGNYYISQETDKSVYKLTPAGVLTKIAGNGTYGFSGDGGPAINASLYAPMGVAVDNVGNVYIADMNNERIRKVDTAGIITTVAGIGSSTPSVGAFSGDGGPATSAELNQPAGVWADNTGNLFIADANNGRIRKVNSAGIISTVAGGGTTLGDGGLATDARLREPMNVNFDTAGNMYICEGFGGNRIRKVNAAGFISTIAGTGTAGYNGDSIAATSAQLNIPRSVAVSKSGIVYIMENNSVRIRMVDPSSGIISTILGNGTAGFSGDGGPSALATFNSGNIAIDSAGDLVLADLGNKRIRKINTSILGISEVSDITSTGSAEIYPNPAKSVLFVTSKNTIKHIVITNILGQTIASKECDGKEVELEVSTLNAGLYYIRINDLDVKRFVKE